MHCPFCSNEDTQVMETRDSEAGDSIRRRRRCHACGQRFTTYERIERQLPQVVKSQGSRVDYDRAKVLASMRLALRKRPVAPEQIVEAADSIEARLFKLGAREVDSSQIGELVMTELKRLDQVAYIRFASVYRKFEDIVEFAEAVKEMKPQPRPRSANSRARRG